MSNVLIRLRKKRGYPVEINGDTFHVRSLTIGELRRLEALDGIKTPETPEEYAEKSLAQSRRTGFVVGCALCTDESGEAAIPKTLEETDAAWSDRVLEELSDIATESIRALSEGVTKIGVTPKAESVIKN